MGMGPSTFLLLGTSTLADKRPSDIQTYSGFEKNFSNPVKALLLTIGIVSKSAFTDYANILSKISKFGWGKEVDRHTILLCVHTNPDNLAWHGSPMQTAKL